jgi:DNA-binding transcriptional LysR family regulator
VRLGRYDVGLCTEPAGTRDLVLHTLADEPMVIVHSRLARRAARGQPLIAIEPTSTTWRAIHSLLNAQHERLLAEPLVAVESFGAVLQMARAGFGNGLVPLGLAIESRIARSAFREVAGVARRVVLVTRKTVNQLASFGALRGALHAAAEEYFDARRTRE